jgi:hypothetical protein
MKPSDTLTFTEEALPISTSSYSDADLQVEQANLTGASIAGLIKNATGKLLTGPYGVYAYCFTAAGKPVYSQGTFTSNNGTMPLGDQQAIKSPFTISHAGQILSVSQPSTISRLRHRQALCRPTADKAAGNVAAEIGVTCCRSSA